MNEKLTTSLGTGKRKIMAIGVASALVLTIGATTAFAASAVSGGKLLTKNTNGIVTHSTDDGATWNMGAANGFEQNVGDDGTITGVIGRATVGGGIMTKNQNGIITHSTDGGTTWKDGAPGGMEQIIGDDGSIALKMTGTAGGEKLLTKSIDGVVSYSTDDGATWTAGKPEGFEQKTNADGTITGVVGKPAVGRGSGIMTRNQNGIITHSTDGGTTWTEGAPAGVRIAQP